MYYFYKQGTIPPFPSLAEGIEIKKVKPNAIVRDMSIMQMGRMKYFYYQLMTFIYRGFKRVFKEYDVVIDNTIVSKAVLISKVPVYKFLPKNGIHICYCETVPEARGKGYYPLLLKYIQNDMLNQDFYMIVDEDNISSIKGIEKAGFIRYANGQKTLDGRFVEL